MGDRRTTRILAHPGKNLLAVFARAHRHASSNEQAALLGPVALPARRCAGVNACPPAFTSAPLCCPHARSPSSAYSGTKGAVGSRPGSGSARPGSASSSVRSFFNGRTQPVPGAARLVAGLRARIARDRPRRSRGKAHSQISGFCATCGAALSQHRRKCAALHCCDAHSRSHADDRRGDVLGCLGRRDSATGSNARVEAILGAFPECWTCSPKLAAAVVPHSDTQSDAAHGRTFLLE